MQGSIPGNLPLPVYRNRNAPRPAQRAQSGYATIAIQERVGNAISILIKDAIPGHLPAVIYPSRGRRGPPLSS